MTRQITARPSGRIAVALASTLLVFLLLHGGVAWMKAPVAHPKIRAVHQLECAFDRGRSQPRRWRQCRLPHNWDQHRPDYTGDALYRFRMPRPADGAEPRALWLVASMNASVAVNGVLLGSGGSMVEPVARHWNHYLLFMVPNSMLNRERNRVVIRVHGYANNSSGLLRLYVGSASLLKRQHQALMFRSNLLTYGALVVTLLIGLLAAVAALVGRSPTVAYFSLGCLISTIYLLDTIMVNIPVSRDLWERCVHISIVCSEVFFILFAFRVLDHATPRLAAGMFIYGILGTLVIALTSGGNLLPAASIWEGLSLIMVMAATVNCLWLWCREGNGIAFFVALALVSVLTSFAHDWIPWVLGQGVEPPFTFYLGPAGFIIMMATVLTSKLIADYHQERHISLSLREKVRVQDLDIQRKNASIAKLSREQAVRDERDRILRELHDGVGGMLSSVLSVVDPESSLRGRLQRIIDELRLVMGTIDDDADTASLLGTLRPRLEADVAASGGVLKWDVEDVPSRVADTAHTGMQLVRIVQECVHNSLRHGHAREIVLRMDRGSLSVSDNGSGFDVRRATAGRGLKNLRWRAEKLGANIDITSGASGTTVHIFWE